MPRGGKRPGAGAKPGNLNALKHGRYSQQFAIVGALLAQDPQIRQVLLDIGKKHQMKQQRASTVAAALFAALFQRAQNTADRTGRSNLTTRTHDLESIKAAAAQLPYEEVARTIRKMKKAMTPSNPPNDPQKPSDPRHETPLIEPRATE